MNRLILASTSPTRRTILANAGLAFDVMPPPVEERAVEAPLLTSGIGIAEIAAVLAEAKAESVSALQPDRLVIGADQTLEFEGVRLTKPASMDEARRQLLAMAGQSHALHSAVTVAKDGNAVWRHVETAVLTMRPLTPAEIGRYVGRVGASAVRSVGGYQVEGMGINLFEKIEGDHFTILGLPLLPLLAYLRGEGIGL